MAAERLSMRQIREVLRQKWALGLSHRALRALGSAGAPSAPRRAQDPQRRDLLEILEDRYGTRSTIITGQLPPAHWHDYVADPTLADAICDRILHNAHRIVLQGPSRRKEGTLDS